MRRALPLLVVTAVLTGAAHARKADAPPAKQYAGRVTWVPAKLPDGVVGQEYKIPSQALAVISGSLKSDWPAEKTSLSLPYCSNKGDAAKQEPVFDDCGELPPGMKYDTIRENGGFHLVGAPTKPGRYSFRLIVTWLDFTRDPLADYNHTLGYAVQKFKLFVVAPPKQYDLVVHWISDRRFSGETWTVFGVQNVGDAPSPATTLEFTIKLTSNSNKEVSSGAVHLLSNSKRSCENLKCTVPALKPGTAVMQEPSSLAEFLVTFSLVGAKPKEGGTYIKVRADLHCVEADEKSCANNHFPTGTGTYQRVTIPGK